MLLAMMTIALVVVAVLAAIPSLRRESGKTSRLAALGDPLAEAVFLGAGLVHMLPDAVHGFVALDIRYPWPFVISGGVALGLVLLGRLGSNAQAPASLSLFAAAALSIHSLLAGAALGTTSGEAALVVLFLALIAHKGAASFSLSRQLAHSSLRRGWAIAVQGGFVIALPIGVVLGTAATYQAQRAPLAIPVILATGAGTFLYFGAMHRPNPAEVAGWAKPVMAIIGFAIMAIVAAVA